MSKRTPNRTILMTSVAGFALALAGPVLAQEDTEVGEVVVTASRAAVTGYSASTPTTVIGAETFANKGLTNVADVVTQNPAFAANASPGGNGVKSAAPGQTTADLRGLGGQRTLVLVNGSRVVPYAPATSTGTPVATDLNTVPAILINRAEVVTGGASAQWGSDAIAGVVNIILNNTYQGLKATAQYGVTEEGDAERTSFGVLGGTSFADGRGHIVAAAEYQKNTGLGDYTSRDYTGDVWGLYSVPAAYRAANPGTPALLRAPGFYSAYATGGRITGPAGFTYNNYQFLPGGGVAPWDPGAFTSGQVQLGGGEGIASWTGINLYPQFKRYSTYARGQYDLTDNVTASLEVGYAYMKGGQNGSTPRVASVTIRQDNAFLPTAVRDAMIAQGVPSFTMSRMSSDIGYSVNRVRTKTPHFAVGLEGRITDDWKWDAHYTWGKNKYYQRIENNFVTSRYNFASDAVVNPATGQIVCRATLPGASFNAAAAGCVPANLFGNGSPSAAARDYITDIGEARSTYKQETAALNLQGTLFELPAGPIAIGTGVEWRRESQTVDANELANAAAFLAVGNATDFAGKFNTKEAYIDSIIPLLKDHTIAKALDLNAAFRIADYSSAGTAKTWKLGLNWEPVDGVKFRVTKSKDIRAPAIYELFGGGQWITTSVSVRGQTVVIPQNFTAGNPDLDVEKAKTFTAGVVYEPSFIPGLRMSVDYFDIKIDNAIVALNSNQTSDLCTQGSAFFCSLFTFDANGVPTRLLAPSQNLAKQQVEGVDFQLNYSKDLSDFPGMPERSGIDLAVQGTYTDHYIIDTGAIGGVRVDRAGENADAAIGAPRWRMVFTQTLRLGKGRITAEQFFISKGVIDNSYNTAPNLTINDNKVPKYLVMNLYGSYDISDKLRAFAAVDNVFDKAPPLIPRANFPIPEVAGTYYDKLGRGYRMGLTYEF